jgi:hypothetical protein
MRILSVLSAAATLALFVPLASGQPGTRAPGLPVLSLRFHHLHFNVTDPAASMNALAAKVQGTRVILQGLGVGVRSGDHYVLFDRADDDPGVPATGAVDRYRRGVAWLKPRGATVEPPGLQGSAFAAVEMAGTIDHIAFSTSDLAAAVDALSAAGAVPVRRTDDAARF